MNILILYGTLTGNTEQVAHHLHEHASANHSAHQYTLASVNDIAPGDVANYDMVVFGISTYGEGEINPAAVDFFEALKAEPQILSGKKAAVFGLGETSYELFCHAAVLVKKIAQEQGAEIVGEIHKIDGYPDEDILSGVATWSDSFLS